MTTYTLKEIAEMTHISYNTIRKEIEYDINRKIKRLPVGEKCKCGAKHWLVGQEWLDYFMEIAKKRGLIQEKTQ